MQRQQFYPKQYVDVTAMMTLQATPQNGIKDALVSIGAKGVVNGLGITNVLPYSWSFTVGVGKAILEDGSIISNAALKTYTINPAILTPPATGVSFYAVFLIPKLTQNTPIIDPDGDTINYIEFDDFNLVYVANAAQADGHPNPTLTAGAGYVGVRLGDIARRPLQTNLQPGDFDTTYFEGVTNNQNLFDLSQIYTAYNGILEMKNAGNALLVDGTATINTLHATNAVMSQLQVVANIVAANLIAADGSTSIRQASGLITMNATQLILNAVLSVAQIGCSDVSVSDQASVYRLGNYPQPLPGFTNLYTLASATLYAGSTDFSGTLNFVTGPTQIDASERGLAELSFVRRYATLPKVFLSPANAAASAMGTNIWPQVESDGTGFFVHLGLNANIPVNTTFTYSYMVIA